MMQHPFFSNKKILVVDKAPKNINDHTWCFWEKEPGLFEPVVHHQWQDVHFYSDYFSSLLHLTPYSYKMIRSIDLYSLIMQKAAKNSNITFLYGTVTSAGNEAGNAWLVVDSMRFTSSYIFNSILFESYKISKGKHHLLQHFKGLLIETEKKVFDASKATLMDFRVSQQHGTTFMYVLPVNTNKALVEYTLFTKNLLLPEQYSNAIHKYIKEVLDITEYNVVEEEFGIIPMTNAAFAKHIGNIINIGTAGGQTKPSTGYTFQFIQKQCNEIVNSLVTGKPFSKGSFKEKKFFWYDSVLLNVLAHNRMSGDKLFAQMFQKNNADKVLKFLDNETSLLEDLKILTSLPFYPFIKAGLEET